MTKVGYPCFFSKLTKSLSLEESSWGLSDTVLVGGVDKFGVPGRELGAEVEGVTMTGVEDEVEVMVRLRNWRAGREKLRALARLGRNRRKWPSPSKRAEEVAGR